MYSPSCVRHTSVVTRTDAGITISHQQFDSNTDSDMDMRLPHETVVRGKPNPKKLSVDSVIIA